MSRNNPNIEEYKKIAALKRCGHERGYKCGCRGEREDKVFDTVDEMNLKHGKRRKDFDDTKFIPSFKNLKYPAL